MIAKVGLRLVLLLTVGGTIACDRVTKHVASTTLAGTARQSFLADTVRLEYVENTGGFLSLGADLPPAIRTGLFTIVNGATLLVVVAAAIRFRWTGWLHGRRRIELGGPRDPGERHRLSECGGRATPNRDLQRGGSGDHARRGDFCVLGASSCRQSRSPGAGIGGHRLTRTDSPRN
jgi:hypothetical protein